MDERFIGRIIDDERVVTAGIVHPPRESVAAENSPCRIVRVAEVDDVGDDRRKIGNEGVLFRTGKIDEVAPVLPVPCSGAARHGIGVDIDRVHGVCDRHSRGERKQLLYVGHVAFRAVTDKDIFSSYIDAPGSIVMRRHRFAQEGVALFRPIASEGGSLRHLFYSRVQSGNDRGNKRLCDITYAKAYDRESTALFLMSLYLGGYSGKKIGARQTGIMFIAANHASPLSVWL